LKYIEIHWYVILGIILLLGALFVYGRFALKRSIKNRNLLQDFFATLSKTFEATWTAHHQDSVAKATVARAINLQIRGRMEKRFQQVLPRLCYFPLKAFAFFSDHHETNRYITTMYNEFRGLYKEYKHFGAGEDIMEEEFYKQSEKAILAELEKTKKEPLAKSA